ncbi:MAG: hypothetical protein AAFX56_01275 [Pseudomonadota bacterium]
MSGAVESNVDYRLLSKLSSLVLCSKCFRSGRVSPVPQLITRTRRPTNLCPACRVEAIENGGLERLVTPSYSARILRLEAE